MLQRLEAADRDAELLALLQVVDGDLVRRSIAPTASRTDGGDRFVDDAFGSVAGALGRAEHGVASSTRTPRELDVGGAQCRPASDSRDA